MTSLEAARKRFAAAPAPAAKPAPEPVENEEARRQAMRLLEAKHAAEKLPPLALPTIKGLAFCLTGKMNRLRRDVALEITAAGGRLVKDAGVADYLVVGKTRKVTVKVKAARAAGVRVISERELRRLIAGKEI